MGFIIVFTIGIVIALLRVANDQKKRKVDRLYLSSAPPPKKIGAQRQWNGFLDARGASAFWSFGASTNTPDWVEVIVTPSEPGLTLTVKQFRPGVTALPVTIPWNTVLSATRGTGVDAPEQPGQAGESAAVIKLNLHALADPGTYGSGELAIVRCFGPTGSLLVTEINKHLYGRVATTPDPATRRVAPAPPRPVLPPRPTAAPSIYVAAAPSIAPPRTVPAREMAPPPPTAEPTLVPAPAAVPESAEPAVPAEHDALAFADDGASDLQQQDLDALRPASIEMSSFEDPLDLSAHTAVDSSDAATPPLVAAPWPPPVPFVLPDAVKVVDEQQ
jgi:hypothetical protein